MHKEDEILNILKLHNNESSAFHNDMRNNLTSIISKLEKLETNNIRHSMEIERIKEDMKDLKGKNTMIYWIL